jgi:hypothetical protein
MSRLGIYASQISGHLANYAFESIATVTVGSGGTSSISFSSIPSTYKHLQIRAIGRAASGQSATSCADVFMRVNSDTGANYARHRLLGEASMSSGAAVSQTQIPWTSVLPRTTSAANTFGSFVIDLFDYRNTNKYKTFRFLGGGDMNGSGTIGFQSGVWMNTSAISSLTFTFETDTNPNPSAQYSQIALYGVKG